MVNAHETASRFQTTSWTLIVRARASRADLQELLSVYWSPVYAYLRRRGYDPHDAADLTQGFLSEVVLDRGFVERADPDLGRFRSFLLSALSKFVIDEHRRVSGRYGTRPKMLIPSDPEALAQAEPDVTEDPTRAFDRQWAATVIGIVLKRLESACQREGLESHWQAFEARVIRPAVYGSQPASIESLVSCLGARSPEEVSSMLHTVKRKFRRVLRDTVAETLDGAADLELELAELRRFLSVC